MALLYPLDKKHVDEDVIAFISSLGPARRRKKGKKICDEKKRKTLVTRYVLLPLLLLLLLLLLQLLQLLLLITNLLLLLPRIVHSRIGEPFFSSPIILLRWFYRSVSTNP